MPPELFEDYFNDTRRIAKADMIAFMKASASYGLKPAAAKTTAAVRVFVGEKETRVILRSADAVCELIPGSVKTVLPGLYHGGFSLCEPRRYAETVIRMLDG